MSQSASITHFHSHDSPYHHLYSFFTLSLLHCYTLQMIQIISWFPLVLRCNTPRRKSKGYTPRSEFQGLSFEGRASRAKLQGLSSNDRDPRVELWGYHPRTSHPTFTHSCPIWMTVIINVSRDSPPRLTLEHFPSLNPLTAIRSGSMAQAHLFNLLLGVRVSGLLMRVLSKPMTVSPRFELWLNA